MSEQALPEQVNSPMGAPAEPRGEAVIRRKVYAAVSEADDFLREILREDRLTEAQRTDARRVRCLLAEWRLENQS